MDAVSVAPFFYYSPDPQGRQQKQHGHHGQFLAQPHAYIPASTQLLSPIPISPVAFPSQLVLGGRGIPLTITPAASPSLIEQSYIPSEMCTESVTPDYFFNPATPPLTHSAVSTPSISYAMPTPISNHGWSSLDEPIIATVAPSEIQLATPVEFIPSGLPTPIVKSNASPPPSIALNDVHCPALSPCSSQSSFCDPRELLIQTPTPVEVRPDVVFPPMTSLGGDDDHFLFGGSVEDFLPTASSGIKTPLYMSADFNEELSDLGDSASEDDFINEFSKSIFLPSKRVKYEDDSDVEQLPSPPWSENSSREGSSAPSDCSENHSKRCKTDDDEMSEAERLKSFKFGSHSCSDSCDSPCEKPSSAVMAASRTVIRRGRKQSLTDDPTKTFVCHICTRRFRRQEHLKRHFRSLHTDDKPFKCTECNKSFSRSDNLTQHSRIHGTGAVVLGVLTEDEVPALGTAFLGVDTELSSPPLGIVVVDALTAAGEAKESKSSEDKKARRKRKRSDE